MPDQCGSCPSLGREAHMGYRRMVRIFVCEGHILKGHIVSLGMFGCRSLHLRLGSQDHVDAAHGLLRLHFVAGHIHDLVEHDCTGRRKDHIEQKTLHKADQVAGNKPYNKRRGHQYQKTGIDDRIKSHHSLFAGHRVGQSELPVRFDGVIKLGDRLHCLSEHLDYRNAPDVLHRLMVHRFQRVLVGLHEFHAVLPHEGPLQEETNAKEQQERDTYTPVKDQHQHQTHNHRDLCAHQVGKLVSDKSLGLKTVIVDDLPQFSAGICVKVSHRHFCEMFQCRHFQVFLCVERYDMGAEQC